MTAPHPPRADEDEPEPRIAGVLEAAALVCILAAVAARPFANELPFRYPNLVFQKAPAGKNPREFFQQDLRKAPDELATVTIALVLLTAGCLWAGATALRKEGRIAAPGFGLLLVLFAGGSLVSALGAGERRGAVNAWLDQVAVLLAAFVTMQLTRQRRRRGLVIVVLAALAVTMAWKGLDEVFSEIPQRIATFEQDRDRVFRTENTDPASPKARMLEYRIRDRSVTGYLGLSNVLASLLIVASAAAVGLAAEKLASAARSRKTVRMGPGEVHLPTLAAGAGVLLAAAALAPLVLTRSKGGIAAAALALAAGAIVWRWRSFFARHRRKALLALAGIVLAGGAALAAYGSLRGGLPGRSLQVRWEYWVGAWRMVKESPLRGVGAGNFGDAYLRHRLPAAAESTKSPHNVVFEVACAYGVPTAAIFLAMYAYVLVAATSPSGVPAPRGEPDSSVGRGLLPLCAALSLAVLGLRATWTGLGSPWLVLADACLPAGVFAAALVAAMWTGRRLGGADLAGGPARFCLACGLAGFAAHSLVELAIWFPAAATAFWVAAGAAAGPGVWRRARSASRVAGPLTAALMTGVAAVGVWVWWPVQQKTFHLRAAQMAYAEGFGDPAARHLKLAAEADPLDSFPTGYLATIYVTASHTVPPWLSGQFVGDAVRAAEETCRRNPDSPANHLLLAQVLWRQGLHLQRALAAARQAVGMDPMNMQTRIEYARMLLESGRLPAAAEQLAEVRRIDRARAADDILRLTPEELRQVEAMQRQIGAARS